MTEQFKVQEADVAGFGLMTDKVHTQTLSTLVHVHEARPTTGYSGLMELLSPTVEAYCTATVDRIAGRSSLLADLPEELKTVAWRYHTTDAAAYERSERLGPPALPGQTRTVIRPFPHPASYSAGTDPSLDAPGHEDPPIQDLIDEVGGSIKYIDWAVSKVWESPVAAIVEPLAGNWTELERADVVLTQVGDACEQIAQNLTSQLGRLSGAWQGGAANSFEDYLTRLAAALEIEGPINRLVGEVLVQVAGEVEKAAQFMVSTLKTAVDKIAKAIATGAIPIIGWYRLYDTVRTVINVFQEAKALVESLQETIEKAQGVIDAVKDPVGFAEGKAEEVLGPYVHGAEVAEDLGSLDPGALTEAPTEEYDPGAIKRAG